MTPEERLAELLRALPARPDGVGRGGEAAARRAARARDALGADRARRAAACEGDRGSRGAAPRGGRRADADRRRPPAHPARGMTSTTRGVELAGVTLGGLARGARRARARARGRLGGGAGDDDGGRPRPARRTCLTGLGRGAGDRGPGRRARGPRAACSADDDHRVYARALRVSSAPPRAMRRSARPCATRRACPSRSPRPRPTSRRSRRSRRAREPTRCVATRGRRRRSRRPRRPRRAGSSQVNLATRPDDDMTTRAAQAQRAATAARDVALSAE